MRSVNLITKLNLLLPLSDLVSLVSLLGRAERIRLLALFPVLIVGSFLEVIGVGVIPALIGVAVRVAEPEGQADSLLSRFLPGFQSWQPLEILRIGAFIVIAVFAVKNIYIIFQKYISTKICKHCQVYLGRRMFRAYLNAPMDVMQRIDSAQLIRSLNVDVKMVGDQVLISVAESVVSLLGLIGVLLLLFLADWRVGLGLSMLALGVGLTYLFFLNPISQRCGATALAARLTLVKGLKESAASLRETRVMGLGTIQLKRVVGAMKTLAKANVRLVVISSLASPMLEFVAVSAVLVFVVLSVDSLSALVELLPVLSLVILSLAKIRGYVSQLGGRVSAVSFRMPAVRSVTKDIREWESLNTYQEKKKTGMVAFRASIEFKNVSYRYPGASEFAIKDASFTIAKGEKIAIVGETGSGKSTLVDLAIGIRAPSQGRVEIDGVSTDELDMQSLDIGYVPQFIHLYSESLRDNIAVGEDRDSVNERRLDEVIRLSQIEDFVVSHADGLDLHLGENGAELSGGQRQRVALARALYRDPDILILDEATSALDEATESKVVDSLASLSEKLTVIMIGHRKKALVGADREICVAEGQCVVRELSNDCN